MKVEEPNVKIYQLWASPVRRAILVATKQFEFQISYLCPLLFHYMAKIIFEFICFIPNMKLTGAT